MCKNKTIDRAGLWLLGSCRWGRELTSEGVSYRKGGIFKDTIRIWRAVYNSFDYNLRRSWSYSPITQSSTLVQASKGPSFCRPSPSNGTSTEEPPTTSASPTDKYTWEHATNANSKSTSTITTSSKSLQNSKIAYTPCNLLIHTDSSALLRSSAQLQENL